MQYAYKAIIFSLFFSATTGWNSMKLYRNVQYQQKMRISSPWFGQTLNSELQPLISYAVCIWGKLYGDFQYQEEMRIPSPWTGQTL
jgi:hypothetical protein